MDYFTLFNLENLSEKKIDYSEYWYGNEPIIIKKFKGKFYLMCVVNLYSSIFDKKSDWRIVEESEGKFIKKEELNNDEILDDNLIFLNNNLILSWNYKGNIINILSY